MPISFPINPAIGQVYTLCAEYDNVRTFFSPEAMQPIGIDIIRNAYIYSKIVDPDFIDAEDVLE